jgi:hypothetical protein
VCGQLHTLAALPHGETASGTHWIGGWVGPRAGMDAVEKINFFHCRGSKPGRPASSPSQMNRGFYSRDWTISVMISALLLPGTSHPRRRTTVLMTSTHWEFHGTDIVVLPYLVHSDCGINLIT